MKTPFPVAGHAVLPAGYAHDHQVTGRGSATQPAFQFSSRVAFLVYKELKTGASTYMRAEAGLVHGYEQYKIPVFWLGYGR